MAQKISSGQVLGDIVTYDSITTDNTGQNPYYVGDPPYDPQQGQTAIKPRVYKTMPNVGLPYSAPQGPIGPPGEPGPAGVIAIEDPHLLDLIEMLEIDESSEGLCLQIEGRQYSLVDIMYAQMKFMFRMNVLLIHRQLGRTNED